MAFNAALLVDSYGSCDSNVDSSRYSTISVAIDNLENNDRQAACEDAKTVSPEDVYGGHIGVFGLPRRAVRVCASMGMLPCKLQACGCPNLRLPSWLGRLCQSSYASYDVRGDRWLLEVGMSTLPSTPGKVEAQSPVILADVQPR